MEVIIYVYFITIGVNCVISMQFDIPGLEIGAHIVHIMLALNSVIAGAQHSHRSIKTMELYGR